MLTICSVTLAMVNMVGLVMVVFIENQSLSSALSDNYVNSLYDRSPERYDVPLPYV